ncbi:MAG: ABC transporter ATP-binding protein [Treponema sp.]|nr:ABC transporter ATP-binding protein [Treponema sp.]
MIRCENLSKLFRDDCGIKNISMDFSPGIIYGIIGHNGAGKTTLFNCIQGLAAATTGSVSHFGLRTSDDKNFAERRRKIAFLPAEDYLYPKLTCMENIELATILKTGRNKITDETKDLIQYLDVEPYLHKQFRDCSSGMKKKAQIVVSLIGDIDTIIWDEPNNGLDVISNIKIKKLLLHYKSKNAIILFSSHVIEFLENFADRCVLLRDGEIVEDKAARDIDSLESLFLGHLPRGEAADWPAR